MGTSFWNKTNSSSGGDRTFDKVPDADLPFRLSLSAEKFARIKLISLYSRIFKRCYAQSLGFGNDAKKIAALWDIYIEQSSLTILGAETLKTPAHHGLITYLATTIADMKKLKLRYLDGAILKKKPIKSKDDEVYTLIDFSDHEQTLILKDLFTLLGLVNQAATTNVGISSGMIAYIHRLTETSSADRRQFVEGQIQNLSRSLRSGQVGFMDSQSKLGTPLDVAQVQIISQLEHLIYGQIAAELDMPLSFVAGEAINGASINGDADINLQDNGIRTFFDSIWAPVCKEVLKLDLTYKTNRWRGMQEKINSVLMLNGILDEYVSTEEKRELVRETLGLEP